jgi:uncharacterized protein (TIGR02145 family)
MTIIIMKFRFYMLFILVSFSFPLFSQEFKTIKIGKQIWMAENLKTPVKGSWYYNEDPKNSKYGRLYTWEAAKKACPAGFHLPTDTEWTELIIYLGGEDIAGKKLKEGGASKFNAKLGGLSDAHDYRLLGFYGTYWSSTAYDKEHAWYRYVTSSDNFVTRTYFRKDYGFCVRCIKN